MMNFFKVRCHHQTPCNCLAEYLHHLQSEVSAMSLKQVEKERFSNKGITEEAPRNDLGLRVYNTINRNTATALRAVGRPANTHDSVIGVNGLGLRRYDFERR